MHQTARKLLPALVFPLGSAPAAIASAIRQADLRRPTHGSSMPGEHQKSVSLQRETPMITRDAIMLAIALGVSSALVVVTAQHGTALNLSYGVYGMYKHPESNPDALKLSRQSAGNTATSAPIIVAQGRCFNNHCY
jgi:hypothetical protein